MDTKDAQIALEQQLPSQEAVDELTRHHHFKCLGYWRPEWGGVRRYIPTFHSEKCEASK